MGLGGGVATELMPRLVVGYTEPVGGKLKRGKGLLKPNFGVGPNQSPLAAKILRLIGSYLKPLNFLLQNNYSLNNSYSA